VSGKCPKLARETLSPVTSPPGARAAYAFRLSDREPQRDPSLLVMRQVQVLETAMENLVRCTSTTPIAKGSLSAKTVLVTCGASRRVGGAMALYLGDCACAVGINYRNKKGRRRIRQPDFGGKQMLFHA